MSYCYQCIFEDTHYIIHQLHYNVLYSMKLMRKEMNEELFE